MPQKSTSILLRILTIILALAVVAGCGEGSGKAPIAGTPQTPQTGLLIDAGVSGVSWSSDGGNRTGTTSSLGEFDYLPFQPVTFSIGGIVLGTVVGAPYITPVELTGSMSPADQAALNMLVFLQSLDSDGDPSNGIQISAETRAAAAGMSLNFAAANFQAQFAALIGFLAPGNSIVSEIEALNHFYDTYAALGGTDTFSFGFPGFPPVGGGAVEFELVFEDNFDEGTSPDPAKWSIETGYGPNSAGWGNNEWQFYSDSPDNVRVEDGNLVISAQCAGNCGVRDGTITSGKINTLDKFNFRYGRVVARIKPPVGKGAWPAFWALGVNHPVVGWPLSGEIDFMEMHNAFSDGNTTHFTMHWCDESSQVTAACFPQDDGWTFFTENLRLDESLGDDFHIFEADWTPNRIIGKIDGQEYFYRVIEPDTMEEFQREFYMILNVAMGGTLGSDQQPPDGTETFPQTMLVDYVRVYQATGGDTGGGGDVVLGSFDEATPPTVTEFGGAGWDIRPGPDGGDGNALEIIRDGGEAFAGVFVSIANVPTTGGEVTISAFVYSPTAGIPMVAKLEYDENTGSGDVQANEAVVAGWQTLTWTFNLEAGRDYNRFVILPNLGTVDQTATSYFFDNITLLGSGDDGGGGGGAGAGTTPDLVLFGTTAPADIAIPADGPQNFGSGATFDFAFADSSFDPVIAVTAGNGYGPDAWVAFLAVTGYDAGFTDGYDTFNAKVKGSPDGRIEVKLIGAPGEGTDSVVEVNVTTYAGSTDLGDGWYELAIPFSEFSNTGNIPLHSGWLLGPPGDQGDAAFVFLMTDVGFSNAGDGGGGGGGSGGGSGTFVNGDFEAGAGDFTGWTAGEEGTVTIETDTLDGRTGTFGRLQTTAFPQDVTLSQVALAIEPGDSIDVSFDLYGSLAGVGGVVFVEVIFLNGDGEDVGGRDFVGPAAPYTPTTTWTNYSGNVVAGTAVDGSTFDVSGGVTLQLKVACGGADCGVDAYFDNVTFTVNGEGGGGGGGGGGGTGEGTTPDFVLFGTTAPADAAIPADGPQNFGSGATFDFEFADSTFDPAIAVTAGNGYGADTWVAFLAVVNYDAGFADGYDTFNAKVKGSPDGRIEVKLIGGGDDSVVEVNVATYAGSTDLGDGWFELAIPFSEFSNAGNIPLHNGWLLGPPGDQGDAAFVFLMTDVGFSNSAGGGGGGGGGGAGTTPDFVLFGTTAPADAAIPADGPQNFGSGATFDFEFADSTFDPSIAVTAGEGYGAGVWVAFLAVVNYDAGFADGYDTFNAKVKGSPDGRIEVKLIGGGDDSVVEVNVATYAGSTDLGDGWFELAIPFSEFSNAGNIPLHNGWLLGPPGDQGDAAFVFLMTDVGFSNSAGGGGGGGGGGAGTTPDFVLFGTTAPADAAIPADGPQNFGSGATFDFEFADSTFDPSIAVTAGEGYGAGVWVAFLAVVNYDAGFADGYDTFNAKVKGSPDGRIEVKLIGGGDDSVVEVNVATYAGSTDLGDGWFELAIPFSEFSNAGNIPLHNGWLLGPPGDQGDAAFVFLMTDVGFSNSAGGGGGGGGGGAGTTPDFVLFGTTAPADAAIPADGPQNFGSGATFDFEFADSTFDPSIAVTAGEGYGAGVWVAFLAVVNYDAGFADGYDTFNAKVKGSPDGRIEVKLIGGGDDSVVEVNVATYAGSTDLGDGWFELAIPFSEFSNAGNIPLHNGWLLGPPGDQGDAAFVFLMTDVGFSSSGG